MDKKILALPAALLLAFLFMRRGKAREADVELSDLAVFPPSGYPGDTFLISVKAHGNTAGSKQINFEVSNMTTIKKTVTLQPGQYVDVQATVKPTVIGVYEVSADGLVGSFEVIEVAAPDIQLSNLVISPSTCHPGDTVTISVTATNHGNAAGSREIVFDVA